MDESFGFEPPLRRDLQQENSTGCYARALVEDDSTTDRISDSSTAAVGDEDNGKRRKRGRPFGQHQKERHDSDDDSDSIVPEVKQNKKRQKTVTPLDVLASVFCCQMLCLSMVALREATLARQDFSQMSSSAQNQWVLDSLRAHSTLQGDDYTYSFMIGTTSVCMLAWRCVLGLGKTRFYELRKQFEAGVVALPPPGFARKGVHCRASQETMTWFSDHVNRYADKMPDTTKLHLPSCLTRGDVYDMCETELQDIGVQPCSRSHFYYLWRTHFQHVAIPKVNRFAKCDKCTLIKAELEKGKGRKRRQALLEKRDKHLRKQNDERRKYYKHAGKARKQPNRYLSMILDGMDQSRTFLPHFSSVSKSISSMWKLKMHVSGVILHGLATYGFFDMCEFPHSSNLTINIITSILEMYKDSLPPVLYLQMDNCGRENKNKFVFAFCCLLVELGIFDKIKVSFLMVGHTHEDVDQVFSRFSTWFTRHSALTMEKLMCGFEQAYTPRPMAVQLTKLYDVKSWLIPSIHDMSMHSKPHVFKFTRDPLTGKAVIHTKKWSTDREWMACEGTGNGFLLKDIPAGCPRVVRPDYIDLDIPKLRSNVESAFKFMNHEEDKRWWTTWFQEMETNMTEAEDFDSEDDEGWVLGDIREKCLAGRVELRQAAAQIAGDSDESDCELSDEDAPIAPVIIGKKPPHSRQPKLPERPLQVGDMCLVDMAKYSDSWPQVAEVTDVHEDAQQLTIKWFKGSLAGRQVPEVLIQKGKGRVPWTEKVNTGVVWFYGFRLTKGCFLPTDIQRLARQYESDM